MDSAISSIGRENSMYFFFYVQVWLTSFQSMYNLRNSHCTEPLPATF